MINYTNVTATEFMALLAEVDDAQVIDVRTRKEYQACHMDGAINIPINHKDQLLSLDKSKTYFVHCRVGGRSAVAAYTMSMAGYPKIYNLNDDIGRILNI